MHFNGASGGSFSQRHVIGDGGALGACLVGRLFVLGELRLGRGVTRARRATPAVATATAVAAATATAAAKNGYGYGDGSSYGYGDGGATIVVPYSYGDGGLIG